VVVITKRVKVVGWRWMMDEQPGSRVSSVLPFLPYFLSSFLVYPELR
jgi:hypothetical protein